MTSTTALLLKSVDNLSTRQMLQLCNGSDTPLANFLAGNHTVQHEAAVRLCLHAIAQTCCASLSACVPFATLALRVKVMCLFVLPSSALSDALLAASEQ